ncbi:necdin-like 2 [Synchiropus picturatus]
MSHSRRPPTRHSASHQRVGSVAQHHGDTRRSSSRVVQGHSGELLSQTDEEEPSASQLHRTLEKLPPAQVDQKVAEVVQYLLVKDQKKIPVRRADIVRHVVKEHKSIYNEILRRASETLERVFGFQLVELGPKSHMYIMVNKLAAVEGGPELSPANPKLGLLFVILGFIFMKGGVLRENVVWKFLKRLRVVPGEKHEDFGDVKKLVTEEFVRQKYLEYTRIPHTDPTEHEFQWGPRAHLEVSKPGILEFMGELYNQDPKSWSQRYKEAHSSQACSSSSSQS